MLSCRTPLVIATAFAVALALTTARAAELTPAEARAIAEEGFIYGLPIVMNYAVMYEYAVDTESSQFKAPFNEIYNMHHVATYEDTAIITPNSDTPYSILPYGGEQTEYYFSAVQRIQLEPPILDISVPARRINEIVHGKRGITADTALRLARYFGTTERFWMNLQTHYDLEVEKRRLHRRLTKEVAVLRKAS
jgi:plasmid maintenance system antidote protein VapI